MFFDFVNNGTSHLCICQYATMQNLAISADFTNLLTASELLCYVGCMTNAQFPESDPLIDQIAAELRAALADLRQRPGRGGRRITVHISDNWASAYIELPPEYISIRK